ncbi:plasmid stabilization protein [Idiomarina zobellii]|uniref:Plasmid stabilization protein n=1 Tax=Idiomarina zobellii TaxID=86103 RepID=A0A837NGS0_9GAMM|nr:plasmid stabilization protein [Idiomarina zobellii]MBF38160.1 plasmid stabilization protein [Idiomarinaceae bacterium]
MKPLTFHPNVAHEVGAAYHWYESHAKGLGDDFFSELEASYKVISEYPEAWPTFYSRFKRYVLNRFPFSIIFSVKGDSIFVIAVMNNRRKPGYWHSRAQ